MAKDFTEGKIQDHDGLTIFCDGACEPKNPGGVATIGWLIQDANGKVLVQECRVVADGGPLATNNFAEYCALGFALRWLKDNGWKGEELTVKADSQLLIKQVLDAWRCNAPHLIKLRQRIWDLLEELDLEAMDEEQAAMMSGIDPEMAMAMGASPVDGKCILIWVPREQNQAADDLSKKAYYRYLQDKKKS